MKFFTLSCRGGISVPATFRLAVFVEPQEKSRKYSNKSKKIYIHNHFTEPTGEEQNKLDNSLSTEHSGSKVKTKGE